MTSSSASPSTSSSSSRSSSSDDSLNLHNALSIHPHPFPRVDLPPFNNSYALAPRLKIVLFGDSLTQYAAFPDGWGSLLAARYQRRADVFNRGYRSEAPPAQLTHRIPHACSC